MKKKIVSEYLKSEESGWVYQPELKAVLSKYLVVGDVVSDRQIFFLDSCLLRVKKVDNDSNTIRFECIQGDSLYIKSSDGTIPFDLREIFYKLK